jgi:hypothetical protein
MSFFKTLSILSLLSISQLSCLNSLAKGLPYKLDSKLHTEVISVKDENNNPVEPSIIERPFKKEYSENFGIGRKVEFKVYRNEAKKSDAFPVGTLFRGEITEGIPNKRLSQDQKIYVDIYEVQTPNGEVFSVQERLKIRAINTHEILWYTGNTAFLIAGSVTGLVLDTFVYGIPIGRGGFAVWNASNRAYDAPPAKSSLKAFGIGFLEGALSPLPQICLRGDLVNLHTGSKILIGKKRSERSYIRAGLLKKWNYIAPEEEPKENKSL